MKFVTLKQDSQLKLEGVTFDVTWNDGSVAEVVATDNIGNKVRFAVESYCFKVSVPAPPKLVKRYELSGTVLGMGIHQLFEHKSEADDAKFEMSNKLRDGEDCVLTVAQVEVPEEEVA